jgi:hypothetical protein
MAKKVQTAQRSPEEVKQAFELLKEKYDRSLQRAVQRRRQKDKQS